MGLPPSSNLDPEYATHSQQCPRSQVGSLRSNTSMKGLLEAENGGAMVELDICSGTSGFKTGQRIVMNTDSLVHDTIRRTNLLHNSNLISSAEESALSRHGTLLSVGVTSGRNAAELKSILGNANSRLKPGAALIPSSTRTSQGDKTSLEQAKPRARVEVDIILYSKTCVQGGFLRGQVKIRIRKPGRKESAVLVSGGKIRVVGFECINGEDDRHTFYQTSTLLSDVCSSFDEMLRTVPDDEGFAKMKDGVFVFPFSMALPLDGVVGNSKGMLHPHSGITVRYIAMFSIKVKESDTGKRSIAHFYRDCEIWPRLNPATILAPAVVPLQAHVTKSIFMGGCGKVTLSASLHRLHWVAGQQCCVKASVTNHTKKTIKSLTLSLFRSTVIFKPRPYLDVEGVNVEQDPDACQTTTAEKQVAESTLQMGQCGSRGHASAKGRLLEEEYSLRVSVSAGPLGSDVHVKLPIKIINFLCIDPPPAYPLPTRDDPIDVQRPISDSSERNSNALDTLDEYEDEVYSDDHSDYVPSDEASMDSSDPYDGISSNEYSTSAATQDDRLHGGNLSICDDTDEVVQHAITSASIDSKYAEHGNRFADLYYASMQENLNAPVLQSLEEEAMDPYSATPRPPAEELKPELVKGSSSFAQRVEEKLRAAGAEGRLNRLDTSFCDEPLEPAESGSATEDSSTRDSCFPRRAEIPNEVEEQNPQPVPSPLGIQRPGSSHSSASGSDSNCSNPSPQSSQTSCSSTDVHDAEKLVPISTEPIHRPEDGLPKSSTSAPVPKTRARGSTVSQVTAQIERQFNSSLSTTPSINKATPASAEDTLKPSTPARPLPVPLTDTHTATSPKKSVIGSATSVKDKIRELEQKAREMNMESTGPL
ncbi:hypothetical protein EDD18DRAFT_1325176 [Armillaria luteobubalina]|uniref:Arrestin C-terminal-like domain-containing protein n=1 Tax=Armillaria luteobubalina TaxID=153913 RepID=A0AA39QPF3_9AGAR|nr:hypothetical protein EDD18DRAFT_1325176 [Armillaria luteobubalina]